MKVKMILPALQEADSPYWRPIKYSLFPPLGLATLAAYFRDDDEVEIVDQHVEKLTLDDTPDLVCIQVYVTNAYRAYKIADHYRRQGTYGSWADFMSHRCPTRRRNMPTPSCLDQAKRHSRALSTTSAKVIHKSATWPAGAP